MSPARGPPPASSRSSELHNWETADGQADDEPGPSAAPGNRIGAAAPGGRSQVLPTGGTVSAAGAAVKAELQGCAAV